MARDTQTKVINGHQWEVTPWDGMFGVKMQAKIAPMLKGAASALAGAVGKSDDPVEAMMNMDADKLVNAIFDNIDQEETPKLIESMMYGAFVDGKDMGTSRNFNEHFAANYAELYQGLWFIVEVNFGDLFPKGATGAPTAKG